jgi:protein tyrosine phosphatase (PTP) superfamily phosphohydrolase (DUF442 family)
MRMTRWIGVVLVGAWALANAAQDPNPNPPTKLPVPQSESRRLPIVAILDTNGDGIIDAAELANASSALAQLDTDKDGKLTREEYLQPVPRSPAPQGPPRRFWRRPSGGQQGGLDNFGAVDVHLLRGAEPTATAIQTLKEMGVTTIINLTQPGSRLEREQSEAVKNGISHTNAPMQPYGRPALEQVNAVLSVITNAPGKVFVHCQAGKDRTGTIVACYRIAQNGWTTEQALLEADKFHMARNAVELREFVTEFGKARAASVKELKEP